jgi:hypothetical protein
MVDRRHLNTLYVSTEGAYVHKDGENAVVEVDGVERLRVPLHKLGSIAPFGRVTISTALMAAALEAGIAITHFSEMAVSSRGSRGRSPAMCSCAATSSASMRARRRAPASPQPS